MTATPKKRTPSKGKTAGYAEKDRAAMLAKIHLAKKQLTMDDDTYRAMLKNVIGTDSCKTANVIQLQNVIDYLVKNGAVLTNRKSYGRRPHNISSKSPQSTAELLQKIEALLADAGRSWDYLTAKSRYPTSFLERITGKQALEFCDSKELQKIIAALSYDQKRRAAKAVANG